MYPVDLKWLWLVNYHFSWSLKTKCCTLHTYLILLVLGSVNCGAFIPIFDGVEPQQQRLLELFFGFSARPWSSVNSCSPGGFLFRECSRGLSHVLEYQSWYTFHASIYSNLWGMINTPTYMITLFCGSTCIGSYLDIHVHAVAFEFLGKRWCRHVTLATSKKIKNGWNWWNLSEW